MAGGQTVGADLARSDEQLLELHVIIAERTRDGRAAGEIIIHERANHALLKRLLEIHNVKRKAKMPRDAARVVNVVERAAAMRRGPFGRGKLREAALVPELHRQANDRLGSFVEERGDSRAVDATAHGDGGERGL